MSARIFISYCRLGKGPEWKAKLLDSLKVFAQHHLVDVWEDGRIRAGADWNDDIERAMSSAELAVFLITPEFLESRFICEKELPFFRERWQREKMPIFPIVCEPCAWKEREPSQWLSAIQSPAGAEPLSGLEGADVGGHLRDLANGVARELGTRALQRASVGYQSRTEARVYLDKFPLTRGPGLREEKLIGREQELAILDLACASSFSPSHPAGAGAKAPSSTAVVTLVAWGGVGKTMLVQHWLQRLQREGWFGSLRVYAWSFYSQGTKEDRQASEDTFLAHALEWFGVQCEPTLSPWDKGRLLTDAVARERTLLILDGIEPLQYPPGPMGGQLRAPGVQSLLKHLARKATNISPSPVNAGEVRNDRAEQCLCLVSTRASLTDLADFQRREGSPWGSVLRLDIGNLTDQAGAVLLHHAGVKRVGAQRIKENDLAANDELLKASREVQGHALTLNLLGRFLARAHDGDIRCRDLVKFQESDREDQGGTTFRILTAFENWFNRGSEFYKHQLTVLRLLGLFDHPADAGCVATLRNAPPIPGLTDSIFTTRVDAESGQKAKEPILEEDWNVATASLAEFGLVTIHISDDCERLLDCHAIIREYFAERLKETSALAWRVAHDRLAKHLQGFTTERTNPSIEELSRLFQAIRHGCLAGQHQAACDAIYYNRIQQGPETSYSTKSLGAIDMELCALRNFFVRPWNEPSPNLVPAAQAYIYNEAAYALRALGRTAEALAPMNGSLAMDRSVLDIRGAAGSASNLSELHLCLGDIAEAVRFAEKAIQCADRVDDASWRSRSRSCLAEALDKSGCTPDATAVFLAAESIQRKRWPSVRFLIGQEGFAFATTLLQDAETTAWNIYVARTLLEEQREIQAISAQLTEVRNRTEWSLSVANGSGELLGEALAWLTLVQAALWESLLLNKMSLMPEAERFWERSFRLVRLAQSQEHLVPVLLARSLISMNRQHLVSATDDLDDAWDIAERGPMRLHMADIHLYRARLFFREKKYPWKEGRNLNGEFVTNRTAGDDLAAAEKLINECGYHRRDQELADAKRAILGE